MAQWKNCPLNYCRERGPIFYLLPRSPGGSEGNLSSLASYVVRYGSSERANELTRREEGSADDEIQAPSNEERARAAGGGHAIIAIG